MKVMNKIVGFLIVSSLILQSCSKDQLNIHEETDPVFTIDGMFGGSPISMAAGDNGAYMYTSTNEVNGVNLYGGYITDGNTTIEIGLFDGALDLPNHIPQVDISNITPMFAALQDQPLAELSKYIFSNQSYISEIEWFSNGQLIGVNNVEINQPGIYEVCAHITYLDQTNEILCNELILGYERSGNFEIQFSAISGYVDAGIQLVAGSSVPTEVVWYLDSNYISNVNNLNVALPNGSHILTAEVTFANGAKKRKSCIINSIDQTKNVEDFTAFELQNNSAYKQDYRVLIKITRNGNEYYSNDVDNTSSTVEINDISYFGKNDAGNDVYKISATIDAKVKETAMSKYVPISFSTVFGIEIP